MKKSMICLGAVVLVLSGCLSVNWKSSFVQPASLSSAVGKEYTVVGHFKRNASIFFTINGLVPLTDANAALDKILMEEVQMYNGDGVINLAIRDEFGAADWLISAGLTALGGAAGALYAETAGYGSYGGPQPGSIYISTAIALVPTVLLQSRTVTIEGDVFQYK